MSLIGIGNKIMILISMLSKPIKMVPEFKVTMQYWLIWLLRLRSTVRPASGNFFETLKCPKRVLWLCPFGITIDDEFELTKEFISCYRDYIDTDLTNLEEKIVFYDLNVFKGKSWDADLDQGSNWDIVFFIYGPNASKAPTVNELRSWLYEKKYISNFMAIFTDVQLKKHEIYLSKIERYLDAFIGIDRNPKIRNSIPFVASRVVPPFGREKEQFINQLIKESNRESKVAICGTPYGNRTAAMKVLGRSSLPFLHIGGGYGSERLTDDEYWRLQVSTTTQLVLMMSYTGKGYILRGHFSESLMAGCITIVEDDSIIPQVFQRNVDYLVAKNDNELLELVRDINNHPESYKKIALQGASKIREISVGGKYWDYVSSQMKQIR